MPVYDAVVEACRTRLRPILMTTAAILAGLVPTALGVGIGGAQRSAIAVTVIGGQALCLVVTLLVVPVAYVKTVQAGPSALPGRGRNCSVATVPAAPGDGEVEREGDLVYNLVTAPGPS